MFLPDLSIVSLEFKIEEVGFTAKEQTISCPEEIPPRIPPALLVLKFTFQFLLLISSELVSPVKLAASIPAPMFTAFTALILIRAEAISASSLE